MYIYIYSASGGSCKHETALSSPHTERRGQTAEIGDFHNAFLYSCACSVSSMHTTGFPFGDRIRCTCQNKYRCTREPGARLLSYPPQSSSISTGARGASLATQRVCFGRTRFAPCQSRTIKVDERWLRLSHRYVRDFYRRFEAYEFYLFIYFDYSSFSLSFLFFFKWIRKVKFFFHRYRCIGFNLKVEFESYILETTIFNGELFKVENLHFLSVWKKNIGAVIWFLVIWNV